MVARDGITEHEKDAARIRAGTSHLRDDDDSRSPDIRLWFENAQRREVRALVVPIQGFRFLTVAKHIAAGEKVPAKGDGCEGARIRVTTDVAEMLRVIAHRRSTTQPASDLWPRRQRTVGSVQE
jgi:hypothetical protein